MERLENGSRTIHHARGRVEVEHLIGIVDRQPRQLRWMKNLIREAGFRTITETEEPATLAMFGTSNPDLLLVGDDLPHGGAYHLVSTIREFSTVPIIVVGSNYDEDYIAQMLQGGVDGYLVKEDITDRVLVARVQALLRRVDIAVQKPKPAVITNAELEVDLLQREVRIDGERVYLRKKEYELIAFLGMNLGSTVTYNEIINKIWGGDEDNDQHSVRENVSRLRYRIERDSKVPRYIVTVWGIGYKMPNLDNPQKGQH